MNVVNHQIDIAGGNTHTLMQLLGTLKWMLLIIWKEEIDHTACVEMAWSLTPTLLHVQIVQLEHFQNREFNS